jgi:cytochrome c peroxidase
MKSKNTSMMTFVVVAASLTFPVRGAPQNDGKFLFEKETFGGNGRTCATCHTRQAGKLTIEHVQSVFAENPGDPLFRAIDSDNGDGLSYNRLLTTATIRVDIPLAPNVSLVEDPSATHYTIFRSTPTTRNVTTLQPFLMFDGRHTDAASQALGAIRQHAENTVEPTLDQLAKIAAFERADKQFYSSKVLQDYANGGPAPVLPTGKTPSEKRGREFLRADRQCGVCHSGPMLDTTSIFDVVVGPDKKFSSGPLVGFQLGHPSHAFDADGNFILNPRNPNVNQTFRFSFPDGSSFDIVAPDLGRAGVTGNPADIFQFKIQTLWGIKDTAPYFHDNSAHTLEEVVEHYDRFFQFVNDPVLLAPLTPQDKIDIVAYMRLL